MPEPAVDVDGLTHRFGDRTVLDAVRLQVDPGERFGLLGPNGSGKSTLFRILATLLRPRTGRVRIAGADLEADPAAVRRAIGIVFQSAALDGKLTVAENLRHHGHLYGLRGRELSARMDETLSLLKVADRAGDFVEVLSGGLKRRVELAKGLLHRPKVLLMDEPTTGLDPGARRDLWAHVFALEGVTVLFTTHLLEEADRCGRIAILDAGRIVATGSPSALKAEIPGDVITVETAEPEAAVRDLSSQFGLSPSVSGTSVRVSAARGHELAARIAETLGPRASSIAVGRPTLEDVFERRTGHRLDGAA